MKNQQSTPGDGETLPMPAVVSGRKSRWRWLKRIGIGLALLIVVPIVGLLAYAWGHSLWWDHKRKPYVPDDRYRWECPSAPAEFDYQPANPHRGDSRVKIGPYTLHYPFGLSGFGSPAYNVKNVPRRSTAGNENLEIDFFRLLYPRMYPGGDGRLERWARDGVHRISIDVGFNPDRRPFPTSDKVRQTVVNDLAIPYPRLGLYGFRGTGPGASDRVYVFRPMDPSIKAAEGYELKLVIYGVVVQT